MVRSANSIIHYDFLLFSKPSGGCYFLTSCRVFFYILFVHHLKNIKNILISKQFDIFYYNILIDF